MKNEGSHTDIKELIQSKSGSMSPAQRRLAMAIIDALDEAAFMTAAQLGKFAGVSEASVVRFVRFLGFKKYQDFKTSLSSMMMERLSTTERSKDLSDAAATGLYASLLGREVNALTRAQENLDEGKIDELGAALAQAPAIYICAARSSFTLGYYLSFLLSWFLPRVRLLSPTNAYEELCIAPKGSLVVGISFPRYTRWTVETLRFAHKAGLTVAALTNELGSPLAACSKYTLTMPYHLVSFIDSFAVPISVTNCLILAAFRAAGKPAQAHLEELEKIWAEQDVYTKD